MDLTADLTTDWSGLDWTGLKTAAATHANATKATEYKEFQSPAVSSCLLRYAYNLLDSERSKAMCTFNKLQQR